MSKYFAANFKLVVVLQSNIFGCFLTTIVQYPLLVTAADSSINNSQVICNMVDIGTTAKKAYELEMALVSVMSMIVSTSFNLNLSGIGGCPTLMYQYQTAR